MATDRLYVGGNHTPRMHQMDTERPTRYDRSKSRLVRDPVACGDPGPDLAYTIPPVSDNRSAADAAISCTRRPLPLTAEGSHLVFAEQMAGIGARQQPGRPPIARVADEPAAAAFLRRGSRGWLSLSRATSAAIVSVLPRGVRRTETRGSMRPVGSEPALGCVAKQASAPGFSGWPRFVVRYKPATVAAIRSRFSAFRREPA